MGLATMVLCVTCLLVLCLGRLAHLSASVRCLERNQQHYVTNEVYHETIRNLGGHPEQGCDHTG
jgi:hypothetical protein